MIIDAYGNFVTKDGIIIHKVDSKITYEQNFDQIISLGYFVGDNIYPKGRVAKVAWDNNLKKWLVIGDRKPIKI
jgi:hypothetical protein